MPKRKHFAGPAPLKHPATGELAVAFDLVVKMAMEMPGVELSRSYGTPALKVKGKLMARLRSEAEGGLALRCRLGDRDLLIQSDPKAFYVTPHYADYPMVLINLHKVRWEIMPDLIERAWRDVAPKRTTRD